MERGLDQSGIWRRGWEDFVGRWRGSAAVALILGVVTAAVSTVAGEEGAWLAAVVWFLASSACVAIAVWLWSLLRAPFNQRDEARECARHLEGALKPPPFDLRLAVVDPPEPMTDHPNQRIARVTVKNFGPKGVFRAELTNIEAIRDGSSDIPLEWTNRSGVEELPLEGGGNSAYQITVGEMALAADGATFHYMAARTPGGPGSDRMRPLEGHQQIRVTVRVVNVETERDERIALAIGAAEGRGPFVIAQQASS